MVQKMFYTIDEIARRLYPGPDNPQESLFTVVRWVNRAGKLHFSDVQPDRYSKVPLSVVRLMIAENPEASLNRALADMLAGMPMPGSMEELKLQQAEARKVREAADPVRRAVRGVK